MCSYTIDCTCISLKSGLLATAYSKLVTNVLVYNLIMAKTYRLHYFGENLSSLWFDLGIVNATFFTALEIAFDIVLLVGAHQKRMKLLLTFYYYSLIGIAFVGALSGYFIRLAILALNRNTISKKYGYVEDFCYLGSLLFFIILNYILLIYLCLVLWRQTRSQRKSEPTEIMPNEDQSETTV